MKNKIMQIYATDGTDAELGAMPSGTVCIRLVYANK